MAWIVSTLEECRSETRGLTAWVGDAHETNTLLEGSSPQVRWICSGVPSAGAASASPGISTSGDAAAANPVTPTLLENSRRVRETGGDSTSSACSAGWSCGRLSVTVDSPMRVLGKYIGLNSGS